MTGRVVDSYSNIHSVKMFAHHDRELNYAKEAIEQTRQTFQTEMRIFTIDGCRADGAERSADRGGCRLGDCVVGAGQASVGMVAAATALALRLNAMTGWIMWALTTFFRELGVVAEGMETIAQPVTLVDAPKAKPLALTDGRIELKALTHHYGRASGGLDGIDLTIATRRKGWPDRTVGCGQVDAGQAVVAVLRPRKRADRD